MQPRVLVFCETKHNLHTPYLIWLSIESSRQALVKTKNVECYLLYILVLQWSYALIYEPPHDKTNNVVVRPAKTQISLGIRPVWSEFSLSAWRMLGPLATHWAHNKDSDQTGRMPRLIWVFAGRTCHLAGFVTRRLHSFWEQWTSSAWSDSSCYVGLL